MTLASLVSDPVAGARAFAAAALLLALGAPAALADDDDNVVPEQVVVRLRPGASISAFTARYGSPVIDSIASRRIWLVRVPAGDEEEFVDIVVLDPDVEDAQPNYTGRDVNPDPGTQSIFVASDAGDYTTQAAWGVIDLASAQQWATGEGVLVAVLDSGADAAHPALLGALAPGGWNFIDENADTSDVGDGLDNDADGLTDESVGHGTAVAGIVRRVAPDAMILPLKVLDSDGFTTTFTMVEAMYFAIDAGAHMLNISMGTTRETFLVDGAVAEAAARGVLVVASAGNEDTSSPVRYPAALSSMGVLSIAATDDFDIRAPWSNFGDHIALSAPGEWITSTIPGGGYGAARGTSFAAPIVTGAAALAAERYRTTSPAFLGAVLRDSAVNINALNDNYRGMLGSGRLDAFAALREVRAPRRLKGVTPGLATP